MAISYHIYANDGQGGPVDYSTPIATVAAALGAPVGTFLTGALAAPSDNLFAVRAFDDVSGVEEANTDARVRVVIDGQGRDVSTRPNAVVGLAARWTVGDVALVSWGYATPGQGGAPARFAVTATPAPGGPGVAPVAPLSVTYTPGVAGYGCRLDGLASTSGWTVQVTAVGATEALIGQSASVVLPRQSGVLTPVEGLSAIASA